MSDITDLEPVGEVEAAPPRNAPLAMLLEVQHDTMPVLVDAVRSLMNSLPDGQRLIQPLDLLMDLHELNQDWVCDLDLVERDILLEDLRWAKSLVDRIHERLIQDSLTGLDLSRTHLAYANDESWLLRPEKRHTLDLVHIEHGANGWVDRTKEPVFASRVAGYLVRWGAPIDITWREVGR